MNPNVEITVKTTEEMTSDSTSLNNFTVVSVSNQNLVLQTQLAEKCRSLKIPYFYSRSCGAYAMAFCDCVRYDWTKSVIKSRRNPDPDAVMDVEKEGENETSMTASGSGFR